MEWGAGERGEGAGSALVLFRQGQLGSKSHKDKEGVTGRFTASLTSCHGELHMGLSNRNTRQMSAFLYFLLRK